MVSLPTNIDASYADDPDNPSRKEHQQHHDLIHAATWDQMDARFAATETKVTRNALDFGADSTGTNDSSAAFIAAADGLPDGKGVVTIPAGNYRVQGLPIRSDLWYVGMGTNATKLRLPGTPGDHMFKTTGATDRINGAGIRDLQMIGVEGAYGSSIGSAAVHNGIDMSSLDVDIKEVQDFRLLEADVIYFDRGVNLPDMCRAPQFDGCKFLRNNVGLYGGEHPIVMRCEFRYNDIGLTGRLNDFYTVGSKFVNNRIGVAPDYAAGGYINNSLFVGCVFFFNIEDAIHVGQVCVVEGCFLVGANVGGERGVVVKNNSNIIAGNTFGQSANYLFGQHAVHFEGSNIADGQVVNNLFLCNSAGAGTVIGVDPALQYALFANNRVALNGQQFLVSGAEMFANNIIQGNIISSIGTLPGAMIHNGYVAFAGNQIVDNHFRAISGTVPAAIGGDAKGTTVITGNRFRGTFSDGQVTAAVDANVVLRDNGGYATEASGQATIGTGTTSVVVTHGLARTPSGQHIQITPRNNLGAATKWWVDAVGATTFTLNVDVDPAASALFGWSAAIQ